MSNIIALEAETITDEKIKNELNKFFMHCWNSGGNTPIDDMAEEEGVSPGVFVDMYPEMAFSFLYFDHDFYDCDIHLHDKPWGLRTGRIRSAAELRVHDEAIDVITDHLFSHPHAPSFENVEEQEILAQMVASIVETKIQSMSLFAVSEDPIAPFMQMVHNEQLGQINRGMNYLEGRIKSIFYRYQTAPIRRAILLLVVAATIQLASATVMYFETGRGKEHD